MNIKRGEIYLAALDPVVGREISKTRPVVVVSNNQNNKFSGIRIFDHNILLLAVFFYCIVNYNQFYAGAFE